MTLRTLFKSEGEEKNSSSTQVKVGRREKNSLTTQKTFGVSRSEGEKLNL